MADQTRPCVSIRPAPTHDLVPLRTARPSQLTWYMCGPTVYDDAHAGHARTYVAFDTVRRILTHYGGYDVTLIMNITDIDDKIIARAAERGVEWTPLARHFEAAFADDMQALGVAPPTITTRVSDNIPDIVQMIACIVDKGLAYAVDGSVYFDVQAFEGVGGVYGALAPARVQGGGGRQGTPAPHKRSPADFALWKAAGEEEPGWDSPWGRGRPGWHIECSAMALTVLRHIGDGSMDLHTGGVDLCFPHHVNEVAQTEAAAGPGEWVRSFLHAGHLHIAGRKMGKSEHNAVTIKALLARHPPSHLRTLFLMHKYSAGINFTPESLVSAGRVHAKLSGFLDRCAHTVRRTGPGAPAPLPRTDDGAALRRLIAAREQVREALLADFDTPEALRVVQGFVGEMEAYMAAASPADPSVVGNAEAFVRSTLTNLGVFAGAPSTLKSAPAEPWIDAAVSFRDKVRAAARAGNHGQVLQECDAFRDGVLRQQGVQVEDGGAGGSSTWRWSVEEAPAAHTMTAVTAAAGGVVSAHHTAAPPKGTQ